MEASSLNAPEIRFTGSTGDAPQLVESSGPVSAKDVRVLQLTEMQRLTELPHRQDASSVVWRIVSDQSDSLRVFDAIQSLYLSDNRPRDRQIAERITELHRDVLAEGEQILPSSLVQFTDFFLVHPNLGFPRITMTPDGTLRARWIRDREDFVAIEFTGSPLVKLVAEIPRAEGQTAAYFASESINSVVQFSHAIGGSLE